MHSLYRNFKSFRHLFLLLTSLLVLASCGHGDIEGFVTTKEGTWHISKYQVYTYGSLNKNYKDMGTIQFLDGHRAIFNYDSVNLRMDWESFTYDDYDTEAEWDGIRIYLTDTPSVTARQIPFVNHSFNDSIISFKVMSSKKDYLQLRYRSFNRGSSLSWDTISSVDMYLTRDY